MIIYHFCNKKSSVLINFLFLMNKLFKLCYNKSKGTTMYYCEKCNFASAMMFVKFAVKAILEKSMVMTFVILPAY